MIGAEPRTQWLRDLVKVNDRGFILTGRDLPQGAWPLPRPPLPFETSLPGVFAVGDVRYGSVKRVAGAVGEGWVAVGSVQQYLAGLAGVGNVAAPLRHCPFVREHTGHPGATPVKGPA
jgi:thioredoxin reductase (NADPH)